MIRRQKTKKESGQGLVEFALIAAIMLAVVLGGIWGISLLMERATLEATSRDAARWAAEYGGDNVEMRSLLLKQLELKNIDPSEVDVVIRIFDATDLDTPILDSSKGDTAVCAEYGQAVEVTLVKPFRFDVPVAGPFIEAFFSGGTFNISHIDKCWRGGGE